jgi:hypothetical protein
MYNKKLNSVSSFLGTALFAATRRNSIPLTRRYMPVVVLCVAMLLVAPRALASDQVTGSFSNFRISERSGDFVGMELHVVPNPTGYSVVVHASEGAPAYPETYTIEVIEDGFTFLLADSAKCGLPPGKYRAKVVDNSLHLSGPYKSWDVPRRQSYWQ